MLTGADPIEVWHLAVDETRVEHWERGVTGAERARAASFRRLIDSARFLASRALARAALAAHVGLAPLAVEFTRVCEHCGDHGHGRPRVTGAPGLEFSITRAGPVVGIAIATVAVGLDAEPPLARVDELLDSDVFSDHDRALIRAHPTLALDEALLALWVAKEAIGKASGLGLVNARAICVPAPGDGPAADALGRSCWLRGVSIPGTAAGALATFGGRPLISLRDGAQLTL